MRLNVQLTAPTARCLMVARSASTKLKSDRSAPAALVAAVVVALAAAVVAAAVVAPAVAAAAAAVAAIGGTAGRPRSGFDSRTRAAKRRGTRSSSEDAEWRRPTRIIGEVGGCRRLSLVCNVV